MHHTPAVNIWKETNRVSELWEELLAIRVSPDPCTGENMSPRMYLEDSTIARSEHNEVTDPSLLEKAGFESLRLIKQALDILSAPSNVEPSVETGWEQNLHPLAARRGSPEQTEFNGPLRDGSRPGLVFIKVSREPEPQPVSAINTRRMAYGLKIPMKPLHKRPIYQRILFSLRHILLQGKDKTSP